MRPRFSALVLAALAVLGAAPAHAGEPELARSLPIALELVGCEALDQDALFKLLAVELQTLGVRPSTPRERVRVTCGSRRATVTLDSSRTPNEVDLLATRPAAWPRLLALSVSEIVIEARARVLPEEPRVPPPPAERRVIPRPAKRARIGLFSSVLARRALRPRTWLLGPEIGAVLELAPHFSVGADLRAELGRTDTELARVDWLSASAAIVALAGWDMGQWCFAVGPGLRVGYLRLTPIVRQENATGHELSGAWAGPELVGRAHYALSARWFALVNVDTGVVTAPVRGLVNGQQRLVDTGGSWISAGLGLGVGF